MKQATIILAICLLALPIIHAAKTKKTESRAKWKLSNESLPRKPCTLKDNGKILSGNTCSFSCCLAMQVREMTLEIPANQCPEFKKIGKPCYVYGTMYPHKWVIKYNNRACYICYNGKELHYKDPQSDALRPDNLDEYTLIRFG